MMEKGILINNRNVTDVIDEFLNIEILKEKKEQEIKCAISNNFAFGGMNTSIVIERI